jgi:hypothetical protein
MRRKIGKTANGRQKSFIYTCALVGLTIYAVPRLPHLAHGMGGTFTAVWLLFVALCVGANLYFLFGADKERRKLLDEHDLHAQPRVAREAQVQRVKQ